MAAFGANAQSSVTVYGVLDAGYNQVKTTSTTKEIATRSTGGNAAGAWQSNRLGFKGTEDIGQGTTANFMYELGIAAGTTGDLSATGGVRTSWVSLANTSTGELRIGRQYNPIFNVSAELDAGNANNLAFGRTVYGSTNSIANVATTRTSGGVQYISPNWGGVTVKAILGKNTAETTTSATGVTTNDAADYNVFGASMDYTTGPLSLKAAAHRTNLLNPSAAVAASSTANLVTGVVTNVAAVSATGDRKESLIGASYVVGKATLLGMYGRATVEDNLGAQAGKRNAYQLGLRYPITATVDSFLTYGRAKVQTTSGSSEATVKGMQAGAMYNLSKRTGVYAAYGSTTGDLNAATALKGTEFAIGVRHTF